MKFSYKVTEDNKKIGFVKELCTVQPPINGIIPNIEGASPDIKIEDSTNVNTSMVASLRPVTTQSCTGTIHLCDQIFGLFYIKPLKLPTDNIDKCLHIHHTLVPRHPSHHLTRLDLQDFQILFQTIHRGRHDVGNHAPHLRIG
jgi:hypothetical protein